MGFDIRRQDVRQLPVVGDSVLHARIWCGGCGHFKDFLDALPEDMDALRENAVCTKCSGRLGRIDMFVLEAKPQVAARHGKHCLFCDEIISEETLSINPHSLHCAAHMDLNPQVRPVLFEPLGGRDAVERDKAANRAEAYSGTNHNF